MDRLRNSDLSNEEKRAEVNALISKQKNDTAEAIIIKEAEESILRDKQRNNETEATSPVKETTNCCRKGS